MAARHAGSQSLTCMGTCSLPIDFAGSCFKNVLQDRRKAVRDWVTDAAFQSGSCSNDDCFNVIFWVENHQNDIDISINVMIVLE